MAQQQAVDRGCDQVVWLDAAEHRWVEEMGGMNLFFVRGRRGRPAEPRIMTPAADRDAAARHHPRLAAPAGARARHQGHSRSGSPIDQWQAECASGELTEVFACGTAAVITPVGQVKGESGEWIVADGEPGPVTMRLREELIGIQYGRRPDPFGWVHKVC